MNSTPENKILLPSAYFGPIEYFYYLNKYGKVIIEQHETWPKQTYRNRTVIVTDKGSIPLTVPVKRANGNHTKTNEVAISYHFKWHIKHWRSIETAYQNSPYFLYYSDEIKAVLFSQHDNLIELNTRLTKLICELMEIEVTIELSNHFEKTDETKLPDLRYQISPKRSPTIAHFPEYIQVFSDKQPFAPNASILDLLFCLGTESRDYLSRLESNI
jgi:hypothetical protein